MSPLAFQPIVTALLQFGRAHGRPMLSEEAVESFVFDLLLGQRALWWAFRGGLVLQDEVLDALVDRFLVAAFGIQEAGPSDADWAVLRADIAEPLFSVLASEPPT